MNKADYTTLINAKLPDGMQLPSSQHRETMHTDPNSIIELVYGDAVTDSHSLQTYTTSNANFTYLVTIHKVGSDVSITGSFTSLGSLPSGTVIFDVSHVDYQSDASNYYSTATKFNAPDRVNVFVVSSSLKIGESILSGEKYNFTINYKALN